MSLDRFSNKQSVLESNGLQRGIIWSNNILPSLMLDQRIITPKENTSVEVFVYSTDGTYLTGDIVNDYIIENSKIAIDYASVLNKFNISRGSFEVVTNIYSNLIGTTDEPVILIKEISPNRRELLLELVTDTEKYGDKYALTLPQYFNNYTSAFTSDLALNFGRNRIYRIINQKLWTGTNTFVVRLYRPLEAGLTVNDRLCLIEELADTYIDNVLLHTKPANVLAELLLNESLSETELQAILTDLVKDNPRLLEALLNNPELRKKLQYIPLSSVNVLRRPNFDLDANYSTITETEFKNWNTLLDANLSTSQQIINSYFSGSLTGIDIGIDYTAFDNFVFYGSSTDRLENFKYKLELLEYYNTQLHTLNNANGNDTAFANNISLFNTRIENTLGTFDNFERWLYYEPTSSLTTHGTSGSYIGAEGYSLTPWPKYLSGSVYYVHHTTSSIAESWYNGFLATASLYDQENATSLVKTVPEHIRNDQNNSEYELFVNMIGQHFDILYTYVNALTKTYKPEEQPKLGMGKEALYEVAQSMGWELANGKQASSLWQYKLGYNDSGSYTSTGSLFSKTDEQITTEVWRRIVNNLPYLLKTKGTARSIKALMNAYGIPQTLLSIREYGGPHPDAETPALIEDRFAYNLYISSSYTSNTVSGSIVYYPIIYATSSGNWNSGITDSSNDRVAPITREIRFQPAVKNSMPILSVRGTALTTTAFSGITVEYTGSYSGSTDYGRVWISHFSSSAGTAPYAVSASTDWLPLYDGDMWNLRWWWTGGGSSYNTSNNTNTTYYVQVQKASDYISGKIIHQASASVTPSSAQADHWSWWSTINATTGPRAFYIGGNANMTGYTKFPFKVSSSNMYVQEYREWLEELDQNTFDIHTLNPTSYVSSLNATASYNTLVRHYPFGSDLNAVDHSTNLIITSSHPASNIITNFSIDTTTNFGLGTGGSSYAFAAYSGSLVSTFAPVTDSERGQYVPIEETYYIDGVSLGGQLPRSEKIRLEDNYLIRRLSPRNTAERSTFDYAPIDSNRLGLFYSQADQVNKDIFDQIGDIALDDYIGNPEDEFDYRYPQLNSFSTEYWKKYTNRNDINAYIRVFSQFDFTLFNQIKQLLPARVDEAMGLLVEPHALERNKIALTKRVIVENPQYEFTLPGLQPTASSDLATEYSASINTSYIVSADSVYNSGSNSYTDAGNTLANIVLRDHVVPTEYLVEEVPLDQIGNIVTCSIVNNFYKLNSGIALENNVTGNVWRLKLPYNTNFNNTTSASLASGDISSQLITEFNIFSQSDILYNNVTVTIDIRDVDDGVAPYLLSVCSLCLIDTNNVITYITTDSLNINLQSDVNTITFTFNNIRIPAYTTRFGVALEFNNDIVNDTLKLCILRMNTTVQLEKVYTSAIRPEILQNRTSKEFSTIVYHYSGSINTSDKILKNAYHATSQSLGLYYSSSLIPSEFNDDDILQINNAKYYGCKLTASDININSNIAAINNTPVIEVYETNANQLIFTTTPEERTNGVFTQPGNLRIR
jgi:hypothetical protein